MLELCRNRSRNSIKIKQRFMFPCRFWVYNLNLLRILLRFLNTRFISSQTSHVDTFLQSIFHYQHNNLLQFTTNFNQKLSILIPSSAELNLVIPLTFWANCKEFFVSIHNFPIRKNTLKRQAPPHTQHK